jgi:excisionase family DNA binding protein
MDDPVITTREAAALLGVSIRTAQGWVENGALDSWKTPGGHRRVRRSAVLALLAKVRPSTAARSAIVVVLAAPTRLEAYRKVLADVPECAVDTFDDPYAALLAIGTGLPALIVLDLAGDDPERFSMLRRIAVDPALGHTHVLAMSDLARETIVARGGLDVRLDHLPLHAGAADLCARVASLLSMSPAPADAAHALKVPVPRNEASARLR